ncbi:restriction endonuclease subunit S [Bacillus sp. EB106-08-02-XG196]|uniref:methylation-associated defense system restriction endonuclease subunit S MAD5 n=1 Tax=Bacillus sp. EB106-08-02-XG196 TaxID=2737049 RepID=UPI0015C4C1E8|nr:restriction endonuclease subunit S [Bacillus sp. EB106-08-02-XG196]NWQ43322.1 restriction endonuclease subunit S [Bacillus sp. EB106-08-02-XG196]
MKTLKLEFKEIGSSMRFDSSYHLSIGTIYLKKLRKMPYYNLGDITEKIFTAGRSKRIYTKDKYGYPYLSNTDIVKQNPFNGCKYNSKRFGYDGPSFLKKGMIVTGRVGAIGQTAYINSEFEKLDAMGSDNIIRIVPKDLDISGYIYAFLSSKYGESLLWRLAAGGVQPYISEDMLSDLPIPNLPETIQKEIHNLILEASNLRVEANNLFDKAQTDIKTDSGLDDLTTLDYEYFGNHSSERPIAVFKRSLHEISTLSLNAFNYSKRVENLENRVKKGNWLTLSECLDEKQFFSSGSFKRLELNSPNAIKLINQSDIFDIRKKGKLLAPKFVKADSLVEYGEVIIAGVGTLGEGETFCRVVFGNEELEGQLISGEFIRMKTNGKVPSGYLFCWLSTDYGFRLIRKTQSGTKLCRPIQELLKKLPVPVLSGSRMDQIDKSVKQSQTMMFEALCKENQAIDLVEKEVESWLK